ncbi:MAG: hypothetical protein ACREC4_08540, partial [Methylocella sp.]
MEDGHGAKNTQRQSPGPCQLGFDKALFLLSNALTYWTKFKRPAGKAIGRRPWAAMQFTARLG